MSEKLLSREETLKRLRELANAKTGGLVPSWLPINNWGEAISHLARSAVWHMERDEDYIRQLRSVTAWPKEVAPSQQ